MDPCVGCGGEAVGTDPNGKPLCLKCSVDTGVVKGDDVVDVTLVIRFGGSETFFGIQCDQVSLAIPPAVGRPGDKIMLAGTVSTLIPIELAIELVEAARKASPTDSAMQSGVLGEITKIVQEKWGDDGD